MRMETHYQDSHRTWSQWIRASDRWLQKAAFATFSALGNPTSRIPRGTVICMGTTLQINLAPTDLPHLIHILPHQIRQLGAQVDEILLTLDMHQSSGRF